MELPLGGVEAHAYVQCGISMLKRLFGGDGDGDWDGGERGGGVGNGDCAGAVLAVELLHAVGGGENEKEDDGGNSESVRCRCEV